MGNDVRVKLGVFVGSFGIALGLMATETEGRLDFGDEREGQKLQTGDEAA